IATYSRQRGAGPQRRRNREQTADSAYRGPTRHCSEDGAERARLSTLSADLGGNATGATGASFNPRKTSYLIRSGTRHPSGATESGCGRSPRDCCQNSSTVISGKYTPTNGRNAAARLVEASLKIP